jgi:protein gp37
VTWQVLTKRAERMRSYLTRTGQDRGDRWFVAKENSEAAAWAMVGEPGCSGNHWTKAWPLPNVWLGVSVEDQPRADERREHLKATPAAVRFISYEPALGSVDWSGWDFLDWLIVGGESGAGARPCQVEWVRSAVDQCKAAGVPVFVKQLGAHPRREGRPFGPHDAEEGYFPRCWRCGHFDFGPTAGGVLLCNGCDAAWDRLRDKKGGDPDEWPEDLRVREFPK